jgi:signal transduction histidine kinase
VRLLAELLRDGASKPELLDQIDREVQEMDALVGELLAGARLDFSALTLSPVKPVDLVRQALERAGLAGAGLLADDAEAPTVLADPTLVGRAIANLLDNAARHGRGARQVRVVTRDHAVAFEVDDAGPGFPPGEEQRVFRPFYAPPGRPRDARSLGLGLALVERIAEAHGGRAWAENLPGGGARVGFEIAAG